MADKNQDAPRNEDLDRALQRKNEDLAGDIESNRNLSGSSTYETLSEEGDLDVASGDAQESDRGKRRSSGDSGGGMR